MNHIYLIRLVLLKCPGFLSQKYVMPNLAPPAAERLSWSLCAGCEVRSTHNWASQ